MKLSDYQATLLFLGYLVTLLAILAGICMLGRVEEQTSFGLQAILAGLGAIGAAILTIMPRPRASEQAAPKEAS